MRRIYKPVIIIIVVAIVALALGASQTLFRERVEYTPAMELKGRQPLLSFRLTDQYGRPFDLSLVQGKVVMLFFGYSHCPDVCPIVLSKYAYALRKLGDDADRVALIFITTDPERDTVEVLRTWIDKFDSRIIGLTGSLEELQPVWQRYNVYVEKVPADKGMVEEEPGHEGEEAYFVTHSAFIIVADKNHIMRFALTPEMDEEEFYLAAKYLLQEG
jgi:protein SCO1/2